MWHGFLTWHAEMSRCKRSGEIVDSKVCAEVRARVKYAHTKCHPSPHTHSDPHVCNLTPPSHN